MKISKPNEFTDKEIINIIITLHSDHLMFVQNWGEFIYGKELNLPPELKNRIFCIWFTGLIDIIVEKEDKLERLKNECNHRNLINCLGLLTDFEHLIDVITTNISKINSDSQLLISHQRNTLVHGRVFSIHNKKVNLKYYDVKNTKTQKYGGSNHDFWKINRKMITGSIDEFLNPLRELFFSKESDYYKLLIRISDSSFFNQLTNIAYLDLKK
ncbi:MAG: hypothetical protein KA736_10485 [Crocinitomicaceae bacterium]|nr:hypothetical protein [Crocinitomicaceae bacterium]